ncbi:RHS repeat-associated core domain-containing protein [Persicobacter psychrovividus]|uniref:RHS repeat-associated core domain-containing protein n=1 Tax=Persicobacter psychrovividus TaxID=387638 RepID=A0ABN6LGZ0_9BACT|nr:hypothetical protein PEPS_46960 [Persicobacter psychrovividus]
MFFENIRQAKTGLYYYGARYYDAQIGRFFTQDRFAEKYLDFTPYQYGANNPIKIIDVNGDWIHIIHDGNNYQYRNGNLYRYNKENGKFDIEDELKEGSFLTGIVQGLDDLATKTQVGEGLVEFFANSKRHAYIEEGDRTAEGEGNISVKGNLQGSKIPTENGPQVSPLWLDLGHELAHTKDYMENGDGVYNIWLDKSKYPNLNRSVTQSEKYATHIENLMRISAGLPLRTHYVITDNGSGWEPSRIIDIKTTKHSIFIYNRYNKLKNNLPANYIYKILPK